MLHILVDINKVRESGRLDFDFFNPSQEQQITLAKGFTKETLGNLCIKIGTGKTAPRGSYLNSGVRIVKVKNIRGSGINWQDKFFISEEFYKSAEKKARIQEGDILMLSSAHNKIYIGRADIVSKFPKDVKEDGERCICVGELIIIRANPGLVTPEYLITFLRLSLVQEKIRKMVTGQTAHLYPRDLFHLEVVLPPREIQEEIAQMNVEAEKEYATRILRAEDDLASTRRMIKNIIFTGSSDDEGETTPSVNGADITE
jgi:restriction endonuclease S subunit